jgi:hypothetical protein
MAAQSLAYLIQLTLTWIKNVQNKKKMALETSKLAKPNAIDRKTKI